MVMASADLKSQTEQAFEFAREAAKLLITLATGVLALTVTFSEKVLGVSSEPALTMASSASNPSCGAGFYTGFRSCLACGPCLP